jgi:threonine/homoserine/homoserine lactone efflux protein
LLDTAVLPGFVTTVALISAAPGPDNAFIAATAVARGARAGLLAAAGMALGMVVHVVATALGLAVVLRAAPWSLTATQLLGSLYLVWLGWTSLRSSQSRSPGGPERAPDRTVLRMAMVTNLTNPKVILFFAALLPQFVREGHGPAAVQLLTLGAIFLFIGFLIDGAIGVAVGRVGATRAGGRSASRLRSAAAIIYLALAALLAFEAVSGLPGR